MPIYLQSIGFSVVLIGVLEGMAEATAGLSKGYFGKLSDNMGKRVPFVQLGYALSAISKPLMAALPHPLWIFCARTTDRFGKGIRTGARDAILSEEATQQTKGRVFGFHRSMDTLGAVIGPILALVYLHFYPQHYAMLFFLAFFPGLLAVLASFLLQERKQPKAVNLARPSFFSFLAYWRTSPSDYRKVVTGFLIFTLFNSSDVFLLLKAKEAGLTDTWVIGTYIFYNLIYALASFPLGMVADRIGLKRMVVFGLMCFTAVYVGMSVAANNYLIGLLFFLYGIYAAATEGVSKAWISNISAKKDVATAIGTFTAFQSLCTMAASSMAGLLWYQFGASATMLVTGIATACVTLYFLFGTRTQS